MRTPFTGVGTALITPFMKNGDVDEAAVRRLARRQVDAGIHFLCPCGTTGENPTLTDAERLRIVEIVVEESKGAVPVLAGAGGSDTRELIQMAGEMARRGVSGFLSVTPYYNKPTQEGLYQHYRAFAESTRLPIVVYNVPGRTGVNVEPATLVRLAQIPNIVGVKEASGNVGQMCEIVNAVPSEFIVSREDEELRGHGVDDVAHLADVSRGFLDADDVRDLREADEGGCFDVHAGAPGHVVDDDRQRCALGKCPVMLEE